MVRRQKNKSSQQPKVQVIPLGGVGEIGKNMFAIKDGDDIIVLDAGLSFPTEEMLGIDIVIPDITYLLENKSSIKGIVLTHGHEDHIGSLPFILPQLSVPIYGTRLTLGLVEGKLEEHRMLKETEMQVFRPGDTLNIGSFVVETFKTNHSIPDSVGLAITTSAGLIVYTSDFKFDQTPVDGKVTDYLKLTELGKRGVLLAISDSTNAEYPGYTRSEKEVGKTIAEIFRTAKGRMIVASFASHVHRIQQVIDAAHKNRKKVAVVGRSMVNVVKISSELGYLKVPDNIMVEIDDMKNYPPNQVVLLTTGSQGEPMSALTRISRSDHRKVSIAPGDTVILSAMAIPGNEKLVSRTIDNLFRRGANVIYAGVSGVHVSGHGSQEELKLMLKFLQPKFLMPVHGEYRHMVAHAKLAEEIGIPAQNIFVSEIGSIMEFGPDTGKVAGSVTAGKVLVDGLGVGDVGNIVLRDRKILSEDGIFIVVLTMDREENRVLAGPEVVSRGFVYVRESESLMDEVRELVVRIMESMNKNNVNEWSVLKNNIRDVVSKHLYERTGRRPMILPIIMDV